jgi:hypothetical protein
MKSNIYNLNVRDEITWKYNFVPGLLLNNLWDDCNESSWLSAVSVQIFQKHTSPSSGTNVIRVSVHSHTLITCENFRDNFSPYRHGWWPKKISGTNYINPNNGSRDSFQNRILVPTNGSHFIQQNFTTWSSWEFQISWTEWVITDHLISGFKVNSTHMVT